MPDGSGRKSNPDRPEKTLPEYYLRVIFRWLAYRLKRQLAGRCKTAGFVAIGSAELVSGNDFSQESVFSMRFG